MKSRVLLLLALLAVPLRAAPPLDPALENRDWLMETLLYTYYWYLDDAYFAAHADTPETEIWVRSTEPRARDAEDRSRFGEVWLPAARVLLAVKRSDYHVPELNLVVKSDGYRVRQGSIEVAAPGEPAAWKVIRFNRDEVFAILKSARLHLHVPGPVTKEIVTGLLRRELQRAGVTGEPQRFFLAARTGVATDVWVYWQNRRVLLQVSGDMDLTDPAAAAHLPLLVRSYNLGSNVVASLLEDDRSNAHITRDRAGRAVFLCVVRGEEILVSPEP